MPKRLVSFRDWLEETDLEVAQIARLLDVSRSAIYQWRDGSTYPNFENLSALIDISAGALTLRSFEAQNNSDTIEKVDKVNESNSTP